MEEERRSVTPLEVVYSLDEQEYTLLFQQTFTLGRDPGCDVRITHSGVSRRHAQIRHDGRHWWIRDLNSTNGTYLNGIRVRESLLAPESRIRLSRNGPGLYLRQRADTHGNSAPFDQAGVSDGTTINDRPPHQGKTRRSKKYLTLIGLAGLVTAVSWGLTVSYQHLRLESEKLQHAREVAADIFYDMKELELQIATLQEEVRLTAANNWKAQTIAKRNQLEKMQARYDAFLSDIGLLDNAMSEEDRIIFYMARVFGETEINMPDGFAKEIKRYIKKWKTMKILPRAISRAKANGYAKVVHRALSEHDLPPHFFYLALQESAFKKDAIGPETRHGIAKGIWQFIPKTAEKYGLRIGPLSASRQYDDKDDRFDFEKATHAAVRYLKDIYTTDAQASGLLVMACYNWGEDRIENLIRKLPDNPRERNFWQLLRNHKIPQETYDYVFFIFAAAVIGENPKLFGFDFDNPLRNIGSTSAEAS